MSSLGFNTGYIEELYKQYQDDPERPLGLDEPLDRPLDTAFAFFTGFLVGLLCARDADGAVGAGHRCDGGRPGREEKHCDQCDDSETSFHRTRLTRWG